MSKKTEEPQAEETRVEAMLEAWEEDAAYMEELRAMLHELDAPEAAELAARVTGHIAQCMRIVERLAQALDAADAMNDGDAEEREVKKVLGEWRDEHKEELAPPRDASLALKRIDELEEELGELREEITLDLARAK